MVQEGGKPQRGNTKKRIGNLQQLDLLVDQNGGPKGGDNKQQQGGKKKEVKEPKKKKETVSKGKKKVQKGGCGCANIMLPQ